MEMHLVVIGQCWRRHRERGQDAAGGVGSFVGAAAGCPAEPKLITPVVDEYQPWSLPAGDAVPIRCADRVIETTQQRGGRVVEEPDVIPGVERRSEREE